MKFHQAGKLIILVSLVTILLTSLFYVLFLAHLWWVNVIFFAIMLVQVISEERRLQRDFGDEYKEYCRRTRRF